jgi:ferredoxin
MKVRVDMDLCESHGECCFVAPEIFELDDDDVLRYDENPPEELRPKARLAVSVCPVQAVFLDD